MQTLDSRQVAEMLGKRHDNFLRAIRKYVENLGEDADKYFLEKSYKDSSGKSRSCYGITKAGCDLIAGRSIGEKSKAFKDQYLPLFTEESEAAEKDYSVKEAAKILGISERSVYRNIESGKIATFQKEIVSTVTAITEGALNSFMAERGVVK